MAGLISVLVAITLSFWKWTVSFNLFISWSLDLRREEIAGEQAHHQAIANQKQLEREQKEEDRRARL